MQALVTPLKYDFALSVSKNSARPTLPLSSMPSKQKRRLTGSGCWELYWASRKLSQPMTGPLSSVEPRAIIRTSPPGWGTSVNSKGFFVTQSSGSLAWRAQREREGGWGEGEDTYGLDIVVSVDDDGVGGWDGAVDAAEDNGGEIGLGQAEGVEVELLCGDAVFLQLGFEPGTHGFDLRAKVGIAADAGESRWSASRER
jgi:hypothetical protein